MAARLSGLKGDTYTVAAAVGAKLGGKRNAASEEEKAVQGIQSDHDDGVDGERLLDGGGDKVEERQHREDGDKHLVVDDGWVAARCLSDHVTDQRHDEERP